MLPALPHSVHARYSTLSRLGRNTSGFFARHTLNGRVAGIHGNAAFKESSKTHSFPGSLTQFSGSLRLEWPVGVCRRSQELVHPLAKTPLLCLPSERQRSPWPS